jgi:urease accessory protein
MSKGHRLLAVATALAGCSLIQSTAWAHPGHPGHAFGDGWQHPLSGWDHLLAMVAVGLLGVRLGGRALWALPAAFLGSMLVGGLVAEAGLALPGVELGILASVLVLGLLVASAWVVDLRAALVVVSAFAVLHGYAHATEMAAGGSLSGYAAGFLLATALLHATGIAGGTLLSRFVSGWSVRLAGGAIGGLGTLLVLGLL